MPRTATCPHCGIEMDVPPDLDGGDVECPACTKPFAPPEAEPEEIAPQPHRRWSRRRYEDDDDDEFRDFDRPSPERRREIAEGRLRPAAMALIVVASIRLVISAIYTVVIGLGIGGKMGLGFEILVLLAFLAGEFLRTFLSVFGAWKMLHAKSYGWGLAASILMLLPACDYPCTCVSWFVYVGFGVWALVIINDSDVRWLIRQKQREQREMDRDAL